MVERHFGLAAALVPQHFDLVAASETGRFATVETAVVWGCFPTVLGIGALQGQARCLEIEVAARRF